jgi:hypothetical protein
MLPLEVVGPGGSLSTATTAAPYGRDASESWQAATATEGGGAWHGGDGGEENNRNLYSGDRMNAALVQRLGNGWRRKRRSGPVSLATDSKFVSCLYLIRLYSALFIVPNSYISLISYNSAYLTRTASKVGLFL